MDKIKVRRLSDEEWESETATEFNVKYSVVINTAIELICKINELIEGYNEIMKRLERINHYMVTHKHINVDVK